MFDAVSMIATLVLCSMTCLMVAPSPDFQSLEMPVMRDVSEELVMGYEPAATDDSPEATGEPDDEGSGAKYDVTATETNDAVEKAWTQERKAVDDTHIDAWNQGNTEGFPEPESWFYDEPEYVGRMLGKAVSYDSDTDWAATVDTDLCRATFFHREGGSWVPKCGWNTYQGIHRPWQDADWDGMESETKRNWPGPRSRSFKGAWKVSGRWKDGGGVSEWATSIVPCDHELGAVGKDNCQRFEVGYGDAANTPLEQRYKTHGCTGLDTPCAIWVCETIPNSTTVIVFDHVNPWPGWFEGDGSPS